MSSSAGNFAVDAFHEIERRRVLRDSVPPVARFGVAVVFLVTLSSFGKYDLPSLLPMVVYPACLACFERVPILAGFARLWYLLIPVFLLGALNPLFDRGIVACIGGVTVSGGWISFAVLSLKGLLAICVTWSLLRKTGVEGIVKAFASLHLPASFGLAFLLMHRYLVMMVKECERMKDAYMLRSGKGKRAVSPVSWGPFAGLLLMRSMDRAADVQAAIELRGGGRMCTAPREALGGGSRLAGVLYFSGWTLCFAALRFFEPVRRIGDFVREACT